MKILHHAGKFDISLETQEEALNLMSQLAQALQAVRAGGWNFAPVTLPVKQMKGDGSLISQTTVTFEVNR